MEKSLEKWMPIIDTLGIEDEKVRIFACEYAEHHMKKENEVLEKLTIKGIVPIEKSSLLPLSLNILSKLNLKDKGLVLTDNNQFTKEFKITFEKQQIKDLSDMGITNMIDRFESVLTNECVNYLNQELETKDTLYVNVFAQSVAVISEKGLNSMMILKIGCEAK